MIIQSDYWTHPGVSQSKLKDLEISPYHYHAKYVARTLASEPSEAMRLGTALHAALLEPETFESRFPLFCGDLRTKAGREAHASAEASALAAGGHVVRDRSAIDGMVAGIRRNPFADKLLSLFQARELPIAWPDEESGILCKAKIDTVVRSDDLVLAIDVKTISEPPTPHAAAMAMRKYGYHKQAAHYSAAVTHEYGSCDDYYLIFVESKPPHSCGVYSIDAESMAIGREWRSRMLGLLNACFDAGEWPFQTEVSSISVQR